MEKEKHQAKDVQSAVMNVTEEKIKIFNHKLNKIGMRAIANKLLGTIAVIPKDELSQQKSSEPFIDREEMIIMMESLNVEIFARLDIIYQFDKLTGVNSAIFYEDDTLNQTTFKLLNRFVLEFVNEVLITDTRKVLDTTEVADVFCNMIKENLFEMDFAIPVSDFIDIVRQAITDLCETEKPTAPLLEHDLLPFYIDSECDRYFDRKFQTPSLDIAQTLLKQRNEAKKQLHQMLHIMRKNYL